MIIEHIFNYNISHIYIVENYNFLEGQSAICYNHEKYIFRIRQNIFEQPIMIVISYISNQ